MIDTRDTPCHEINDVALQNGFQFKSRTYSLHSLSCLFLGCFLTLSIFLSGAALHYRRRFYSLKQLKTEAAVDMAIHSGRQEYTSRNMRHQRLAPSRERKQKNKLLETLSYKMNDHALDEYELQLEHEDGQETGDEHGVRLERQGWGPGGYSY